MVTPDLLRSLRRLEDLPRLGSALGYLAEWRELPLGSLGSGGGAATVARRGEFQWYGILAPSGKAGRAARTLAGRGIPAAVFGLDPAARRLSIAAGTSTPVELALDAPDPLALARLQRAAALPHETAMAAALRIAEGLAGQAVDQRFFRAFRKTLHGMMAGLAPRIPGADRHALSLLLLTRILFLYFIEAKGWLDGRARFLREEVDRCLGRRRSLHRDLLSPLFFGTLNLPAAQRGAVPRRYGAIPFLNGGLFEPHPLERRYRFTVPTPVLRDAFDTLFERFHFTLAQPTGESIAPDMLGRVFEGVMAPDERHATGSYYTPAVLVDGLLRDAIAAWLAHRLEVSWTEASARLESPDPTVRRALDGFRMLDPAVGSGAFLLGALRLLGGADGGADGGAGRRRAAALRRVLRRGLFGVDRNGAAVRLAELRLWLEVVASDPSERAEAVAPLPNLDALIRQGDSLLDPAGGLPHRPAAPAEAAALTRLRHQVLDAVGPEKRKAVRALRSAEHQVATGWLRSAVTAADDGIRNLLELIRSPTLFGDRRTANAAERRTLQGLRSLRRQNRERLRALLRAEAVPWFDYATQFADVLGRGGFDLVAGNPPWVRAEALAPDTRRYLAERYRWFRASGGRRQGYRHQPDVSVAFLERALQLSAPGGVVAFLVPGKLATAGYASPARAALARQTTVSLAADLREDPRAGFDATVYPMALVAVNAPAPPGHTLRRTLGGAETGLLQQSLDGGPWPLEAGSAAEILARLSRRWPSLGERFRCQLGVKTGLNRAFLDPDPEVEPALLRWAARGRDVAPFLVRRVRRMLWPCTAQGTPLETLPPGAARHLGPFLAPLRRRADFTSGKPWTLFRTDAATAPVKIVWSDVARRLEAAPLFGPPALEVIPLNSCYVVAIQNPSVACRLAAWLNCTWCRVIARVIAEPASGGFGRFNARVVGALPVPDEVLRSSELLALARKGLGGTLTQEALDECTALLLGLAPDERRALAALAPSRAGTGR